MLAFSKKQKVLLFLFLGIFFIYSFNQLKESDSFYHIKTGEIISQSGQVPLTDPFSYLSGGARWITHEWLSEVIFYWVWRVGGFWFLMAFVALIGALTYYTLLRSAVRAGADQNLSLLLLFVLGGLTFELWIPRPQIFSYLLFALLMLILERYRRTGEKKRLAWLLPVFLAWANMHASVILGLGVVFLYALGEAVSGRWERAKWLLAGAFFSAGASLLNPNGLSALLYSSAIKDTAALFNVTEWKSVTSYLYLPEAKIFLLEMAAVGFVLIFWFLVRRPSRMITPLFAVFACAALPFLSIRHVAYWPLVSLPFFAAAVSEWAEKFRERVPEKIMWRVVLAAGVAFAAFRFGTFPRSYYNPATVPVLAADFVERVGLKGPLFNLYNEGGYLIWRFYPGEKVSIDGRSEVYDRSAAEEFFSVIRAEGEWEKLVDEKYRINYFFLAYRPDSLKNSIAPLVLELFRKKWPLVYWDDNIVIFARPAPENADIISKYAMWHINPFRDPTRIPEGEDKAVLSELDRLFAGTGGFSVAKEWAEGFLSSRGR